jgi:hypothetical protein
MLLIIQVLQDALPEIFGRKEMPVTKFPVKASAL